MFYIHIFFVFSALLISFYVACVSVLYIDLCHCYGSFVVSMALLLILGVLQLPQCLHACLLNCSLFKSCMNSLPLQLALIA